MQTETDANDPPPTSQFTNDNPLTDLQGRQRAPLKQLSRCLENRTRIESPMSEISDEEVDYGSFESSVNPSTDSDHHNVEYTSLRIVKFAIHEGMQKPRMS